MYNSECPIVNSGTSRKVSRISVYCYAWKLTDRKTIEKLSTLFQSFVHCILPFLSNDNYGPSKIETKENQSRNILPVLPQASAKYVCPNIFVDLYNVMLYI